MRTARLSTLLLCLALGVTLPVRVAAGGADFGPNLERRATRKVQPEYPVLAKRHGVEGTAVVGVDVDADGAVVRATFLDGNPIFRSASIEAAKRWRFDGAGGPSRGHVVFRFSLPPE